MRHLRWLLFPVLLALIVGACGGGESTTAPTTAPTRPAGATSAPTSGPTAAAPTATPRPTTPPPATATSVPVASGDIRIALSTLSRTQTVAGYGGVARAHLDAMYEYVIAEKDGKPDPTGGFATSWTLSADGKTHTVKVRDNVTFHNGDKATAKDIVWGITFARAGTPHSAGATLVRTLGEEIASLTTPDDSTFVANLKGPQIYWHIARLCALINGQVPNYLYPEKAMNGPGGIEAFAKAPIGSGPFKFKSVTVDEKIQFEAVDRHWRWGVPRVKNMEYRVIPEESTRLALLQSNGADLIGISRTPVPLVRKDAKLQLFIRENTGIVAYTIRDQHQKEIPGYGPNPLNDVRVRRAMDRYALDRQALVDSYLGGLGTVTMDYPVGVADPAWQALPPPPKRDVAAAKKLLAEAGYPNGFALDMYVWGGLQPPEGPEMMEQIAVWWEELGIKVQRKPIAFTSFGSARPTAGWPKPTIAGVWYLGNSAVAASSAATAHDKENLSAANLDPELARLGKAWAFSSSEAEYIKNGRAYQMAVYEAVGASGNGSSALMYIGDLFAANANIPKTWKPGRSQYSFGLERVGLRI